MASRTSRNVMEWFSQFGYIEEETGERAFKESYCLPPFIAGMDPDRVSDATAALLASGWHVDD
jgi:hypothetical protein